MAYDIGDDLLGDDLLGDEILGAIEIGGKMSPNLRRALQRRKAEQGVIVKDREPERSRRLPVGFDSVSTIAAAAQSTLTTNPQVTFRPERLVVSASIAASFLINDIKVGNVSQFVASTNVPAEAFSQLAVDAVLKMDTCQTSQNLILTVTNISAGALRFTASMLGTAVY